jgi:hypothetical protein
MKYVVVIESDNELSEDAIKNLDEILFLGDENAMCYFDITSIKQAPEPRGKLKRITVEDFWEKVGYNRALKDCGVIENDKIRRDK